MTDSAGLSAYRGKRRFDVTPEPVGAPPVPSGPGDRRFVVQRHRARRLHYDLRLEMEGLLASWAVPKGPTLDPEVRRLAIHVEDHPLEYIDFEGVIPKSEYGGGDVIVWDRGRWTPADERDPARAIADGELHFDLEGEKLHGRFVLVRSDGTGPVADRESWLLLHKRDDHAAEGWDPEAFPRSVKTGRTNDEVAASPEAVWRSEAPADQAEQRLRVEIPSWEGPTAEELAALNEMDDEGVWEIAGERLRLTNLDKVLFPARPGSEVVTKRDLIRYSARIATRMLPYLWDRAVNLHRYPDGVDQPGFWHKEVPGHAPEWLTRWHNEDADAEQTQWYVVPDSLAALVWLANYGTIELHPWTSSIRAPREPTWALIDIDPGEKTSWEDVLLLAGLYRTALEHLGLEGKPKVTGRRGIQIWVPIAPGHTFEETRGWVETISRAIGRTVPELISWEWVKSDRKGLARLDYTQNAINKTLVAPFSARPSAGAPVSVPVEWNDLGDTELRSDRWTIYSVFERLERHGDPLRPLIGLPQSLPPL